MPLHWSPSSLTAQSLPFLHSQTLAPGTHWPAVHRSLPLHTSPSLQGVELRAVNTHAPLAASQPSLVQSLPSAQMGAGPGAHAPLAHTSPAVHARPSLQLTPFGNAVNSQPPVVVLQWSAVHSLPSLQPGLRPEMQKPDLHTSLMVQASPSSHGWLFGAKTQAPSVESQLSSVHGLSSPHTCTAPDAHTPAWHASPRVHGSLSLHGPPLWIANVQVPLTSHKSAVHTLPSLHAMGAPKQLPR